MKVVPCSLFDNIGKMGSSPDNNLEKWGETRPEGPISENI